MGFFFLKQPFLFVISNNLLLINRVTPRNRDVYVRAKLKIFSLKMGELTSTEAEAGNGIF